MKKRILTLAMIISLVFAGAAFASMDVSFPVAGGPSMVIQIHWTADASGNVTTEQINGERNYRGGYLTHVTTKPGDTAPTANYDITISMNGQNDILGGALNNRSATATEVVSVMDTFNSYIPIDWNVTIAITGNSVANADGYIWLQLVSY